METLRFAAKGDATAGAAGGRRLLIADPSHSSERRTMRRLLVLLALVALVSLACGTAKINLHTIVRSSGDTTQEVSIESTGLLASSMKESADPEKAKADGWTVTYEEKEDSFT